MADPQPGPHGPAAPARAPIAKTIVAGGIAAAAGAALAMAVASLKVDEGFAAIDYLDIAKVPTSCFGHTGPDVHVGQRRSIAECQVVLSRDTQAHMAGVLQCTPSLAAHSEQLAAATRLAFNIGVGAYCGSTTARRFNSGDWRAACDAMLAWDKAHARGAIVTVPGLSARRQRERAMCLTNLPG